MCPTKQELERELVHSAAEIQRLKTASGESPPLEAGLEDSNGATGEPSLLDPLTGRMVRHHKGLATISTGFLTRIAGRPATFIVLKQDDSEGYTATLSCDLTSAQWATMLSALSMPGETAMVDVNFEPMTPNLVPQDIVPNT